MAVVDAPLGVVRGIEQHDGSTFLLIDVTPVAGCARCASGRGCGAGLAPAGGGTREIRIASPAGRSFEVGDSVRLELAPGRLIRSAALAYGLPLLLALGAAIAGSAGGDTAAALGAIAGLGAGVFLASRLQAGRDAFAQCEPRLVAAHERSGT